MAKATTDQVFGYPIEHVFEVITKQILTQMQGKGKEHNINVSNPKIGATSDYILRQHRREIPVHFEILDYEDCALFKYIMVVGTTKTISTWQLDSYAPETTNVIYSEESPTKSFYYSLLLFANRSKFRRETNGYFYVIDQQLENETATRAKKAKKEEKKDVKKVAKKTATDLSKLTVAQLRELAKEQNISVPNKMKKDDIIKLLSK
jgi:Rho termination factor, N-terminal domain.